MELPAGIRSTTIDTSRIRMHLLESGPPDGEPLVLVHGNLSTARFYEHLMPDLPDRYRVLAPDMRGFGDSEPAVLDATRGLADWADDVHAVLTALDVTAPPHLVGWSTGGAAIASYALARPVASLTFVDPVSPYGYGGVRDDGTPCWADYAGSGGGTANPEVVERLAAGDASDESQFSIRNVIRNVYFAPQNKVSPEHEDMLVAEILKSLTGPTGYPGDSVPSPNWPGIAPGTTGILNALSPKYCGWADIVELDPKPPVLWTHGSADIVISDQSPLEFGTLGSLGAVEGWPGADVFPPQPMVAQIRDVLDRYAAAGGSVRTEIIDGAGHSPPLEKPAEWMAVFTDFLATT